MPYIIAATDFSAIATNAIHYACGLAAAQNAQLLLLHSFYFPVMFNDLPLPAAMIDETQKDAELKMEALVDNMRTTYPTLNIAGKVVYGNVIDSISEYAEQNTDPWMIVMGNSNNTETGTWFESTLKEASKSIKFPLLAVPPQASYKPVSKLCFAVDDEPKGNDMALIQLREMVLALGAELHIYNGQPDVYNRDNTTDIDDHSKEILLPANPQYHYEYSVEVDKAIMHFNTVQNIDWLVIMPREHSFLTSLFHKSHTKDIAQHSRLPILLLHENTVK